MRRTSRLVSIAVFALTATGTARAQGLPSTAVQRPPYYMHDSYDALDVYGTGSGQFPGTDYPVYPIEGYEFGADPYDYRGDPYDYWNDREHYTDSDRQDWDPYVGFAGHADGYSYDVYPEAGEENPRDYFDAIPDTHDYGGYDYLGYDRDPNYDAYDSDLYSEPPLRDRFADPYDPSVADYYDDAP
jgi:hypothetical protein